MTMNKKDIIARLKDLSRFDMAAEIDPHSDRIGGYSTWVEKDRYEFGDYVEWDDIAILIKELENDTILEYDNETD